MTKEKVLTQEFLRKYFDCYPDIGLLVRKRDDYEVGTPNDKNQLRFTIRIGDIDYTYFVHRVIWFWVHNEWPEEIDHIDRNPLNNKIDNLRAATHALNQQNKSENKNNTSGCKGVHWESRREKWKAFIMIDGYNKHLGYFPMLEDAIIARKKAESKYFPFSQENL